jgi:type IV pilus assembly protein PilM
MKKVRLPEGLSTEDMEVSVETELAGVVPFDLSEASVDWVKIDSEPNEDGEEYLLVAVRTDKVDERVFLAEQLGLELVGVDGACFAVETLASVLRPKAVGPGGRRKVDLIVDIGHRRSRVYVAADGVHVYEREIQQGCQSLTILISQMLSCAMADAEVKKVKGKVSKAEMDPIYESFNVQMLQEISRAVQLFYSSTQFNWVDTLWLAGRGASTPGLLECLRDRGGFNVSLLDASSVFSSSEVSGLEGLAPSFFLAFGLAFNFLLVQK